MNSEELIRTLSAAVKAMDDKAKSLKNAHIDSKESVLYVDLIETKIYVEMMLDKLKEN